MVLYLVLQFFCWVTTLADIVSVTTPLTKVTASSLQAEFGRHGTLLAALRTTFPQIDATLRIQGVHYNGSQALAGIPSALTPRDIFS